MVDRAKVLAGLKSEVEFLPDLTLQDCRSALLEVWIPLESSLAGQASAVLGGGVIVRE